jgi:hypothetical protein
MPRLSLYVTEENLARMREIASEKGVSISVLIARALRLPEQQNGGARDGAGRKKQD